MRPRLGFVIRFLDRFLSHELLLIAREERRLRARVLAGICLIAVFIPLFVLLLDSEGNYTSRWVPFVLSAVGAVSLLLLKFRSETNISSFFLLSAIWASIIISSVNDGMFISSSFVWFPLIVCMTVYLLGVRVGGVVTFLLSIATVIVFQFQEMPSLIVEATGIRLDNYAHYYFSHVVLSSLATYVAALVFDITQRHLQNDLSNRQNNLKDWNKFLKKNIRQKAENLEETNARLIESERKYLNIYNNAPDMFLSISQEDGSVRECNETITRILGYERDDILGRSIFELISPESIGKTNELFKEFEEHGHIDDQEIVIMKMNGEHLDVSMSVSQIKDDNGKILDHSVIWRDITNRKIAAREIEEFSRTLEDRVNRRTKEIAEMKDEYELILNSVPAMILYKDTKNNIIRANKTVADLLGVEQKALLEQPMSNIFGKEQSDKFYNHDLQVIESGTPRYGVLDKLNLPNGRHIWTQSDELPTYDHNGNVNGVILFAQDISKQKEAEEALKESEVRFRKIFESTVNAVMITDRKGKPETINPAAALLFKYTTEEVLSSNIQNLIPPKVITGSGETIVNYINLDKENILSLDKDVIGVRKDGSYFELELNVGIFKVGRRETYLWIARDVSEKKEYERKLIEARELALSASKAKTQFLSNMSHEIRTPLNSIIGVAEILREACQGNTEIEKYVDLFSRSSNSLLMIVNDVLDLSKIEAGEIEIENIEFDVKELVGTICETMSIQTKKRGLSFNWKIGKDVPAIVKGDPTRIRQVLTNLISNSLKFTERGGIAVDVNLVQQEEQSARVSFLVSDTGIGISEDAQRKIFSPFTQENASTTRKYGGTGLGLSICKKLTNLMGGDIALESKLGEGTTFSFDLKFEVDKNSKSSISSALVHGRIAPLTDIKPEDFPQKMRILVAEDFKDNQLVLKVYFKKYPFEVVFADNGKIAVEHFKKQEFDLVLMDMQMPEMDGATALKIMRALEGDIGTRRTPIFALTANALREEEAKSLSLGFDKHISKPIKKNYLLAEILEVANMATASNVELDLDLDPDLAEFVPDYIDNRFKDFEDLQQNVNSGDWDSIDKICHRILGTAQNYGLLSLDKIISALKASALEQQKEKCAELVEQFGNYLNAMKESLSSNTEQVA